MSSILSSAVTANSPLLRGMISYAVIWPACSIAQEYLEHGTSIAHADWARATRFGVFGSIFMAPVWHNWIKYTNRFFKHRNFSTALKRSIVEQLTYSPVATAYFYFGMTAMERKPLDACVQEVRDKFWPTYKFGLLYWPIVQTINFYFVSKKNRLVFLSVASFIWMMFMAHMKEDKGRDLDQITILTTDNNMVTDSLIAPTGIDLEEEIVRTEKTAPENKHKSLIPIIKANETNKLNYSSDTAVTYLALQNEEDKKVTPDSEKYEVTPPNDKKINFKVIHDVLGINLNENNVDKNKPIKNTEVSTPCGIVSTPIVKVLEQGKTHKEMEVPKEVDCTTEMKQNCESIILNNEDMSTNEDNVDDTNEESYANDNSKEQETIKPENVSYTIDELSDDIDEMGGTTTTVTPEPDTRLDETKSIRVVNFVDEIEDISSFHQPSEPATSLDQTLDVQPKTITAVDDEKRQDEKRQEENEQEVESIDNSILQKPTEDLFGAPLDISFASVPTPPEEAINTNIGKIQVLDTFNPKTSTETIELNQLNGSQLILED